MSKLLVYLLFLCMKRFFFLLVVLLSVSFSLQAEENEWEYMDTKNWEWKEYNGSYLTFKSNNATFLDVRNNRANPEEAARKNHWSSYIAWINPHASDANRAYEITFSIRNWNLPRYENFYTYDSNGNRILHKGNVYWGVVLSIKSAFGGTIDWEIRYSDETEASRSFPYSCSSQNTSDTDEWTQIKDRYNRKFKIVYDGDSKVLIYGNDGTELLKTINNASGIDWIGAKVGSAANVKVTDFKVLRQTDYGVVRPMIEDAYKDIKNEEYTDALAIISLVLNLYKESIPYFIRGKAYYGLKNYKAAISDFTSALQYNCSEKLRFNIYFARGLCYLELGDKTRCIADMHQAGELGDAFLKESHIAEQRDSSKSRSNMQADDNMPRFEKMNSKESNKNQTTTKKFE